MTPWTDRHLTAILDQVRDGFQVLSPDWRYLYVNDAVCRHGRKSREELLGHSMLEVYPGIETTPMFQVLERCMAERTTAELENRFTYENGATGWFELRIQPVPEGLLVLSMDVTERRSLQAQLNAAQKMEAIGRLAGGVAHDFNNILTAILGFGGFARESLDGHPAREDLDQVLVAARRAARLVAQLLAFSRRQTVEPRVIDVDEHLRELDEMLRRILGEDVELLTIPSAEEVRVVIDPSALEQVVVNLAVNARDAMPGGGRLSIETATVLLDASYQMAKRARVEPGPYVMIAVSDNGSGMPPETVQKIFEPFFTTKELGRGTGLGLSTCYGIVKQAGGYIWVYSEPGEGTTFKIYLPRVEGPPSHAPDDPEPGLLAGSETVLVVEDDAQIRQMVVRTLEHHGYRVLVAAHPDEALLLARTAEGLHLLLTDVVLPGRSGRALAQELCEHRPDLRVLYMSGYTENSIVHHGVLEAGIRLLQKPFTPDELAVKVRATLDASQG